MQLRDPRDYQTATARRIRRRELALALFCLGTAIILLIVVVRL